MRKQWSFASTTLWYYLFHIYKIIIFKEPVFNIYELPKRNLKPMQLQNHKTSLATLKSIDNETEGTALSLNVPILIGHQLQAQKTKKRNGGLSKSELKRLRKRNNINLKTNWRPSFHFGSWIQTLNYGTYTFEKLARLFQINFHFFFFFICRICHH